MAGVQPSFGGYLYPNPRKYFTEENAARLDGMRGWVRTMVEAGRNYGKVEEELLLADLLEAASSVANTAGTFGCFLSQMVGYVVA